MLTKKKQLFRGNLLDLNIRTITNNATVTNDDFSVVANASSNTIDVTMPLSPLTKLVVNISCLNSDFAVTIKMNGKNFYDSSSDILIFKGENIAMQYDGTRWIGV